MMTRNVLAGRQDTFFPDGQRATVSLAWSDNRRFVWLKLAVWCLGTVVLDEHTLL